MQNDHACLTEIPEYSTDMIPCLRQYVQDGCLINEEIRDNDVSKSTNATCKNINQLFKNVCLEQNLTLYRGISNPAHLCQAGYTSTSLQFLQARDFISELGIMLHITIYAGTIFQAIKIKSSEEHSDENEVLFPCNTCFIDDKTTTNSSLPYKTTTNGKLVWTTNDFIEIKFVTLESKPSQIDSKLGGSKPNQKQTIRLCRNSKIYRVRSTANMMKYVLINRQKVTLASIRGKYRYVVANV